MKKILLGAFLAVASMSFAQDNRVIEPVVGAAGTGTANTNIDINVKGKVFADTGKVLIVELISAVSPDGRSFNFEMPDTIKGGTAEAIGKFVAKVVDQKDAGRTDDDAIVETAQLAIKLTGPGIAANGTAKTTGTIADIDYSLVATTPAGLDAVAGPQGGGTASGSVKVGITAKDPGTYTDNSIKMNVAVTGA